jgi:hypothetical protein
VIAGNFGENLSNSQEGRQVDMAGRVWHHLVVVSRPHLASPDAPCGPCHVTDPGESKEAHLGAPQLLV